MSAHIIHESGASGGATNEYRTACRAFSERGESVKPLCKDWHGRRRPLKAMYCMQFCFGFKLGGDSLSVGDKDWMHKVVNARMCNVDPIITGLCLALALYPLQHVSLLKRRSRLSKPIHSDMVVPGAFPQS